MKLYYTDIRKPLTAFLAKEAQAYAEAGRRVFYIAPNSLSFEKEKRVLEHLPQQASFAITVTRFGQMARYFTIKEQVAGQVLDDIGLGMLFYQVLQGFSDADLKVYTPFKQDMDFIQQLLDLYHEMQESNMTFEDLSYLEEADKRADLQAIFARVEEGLAGRQFRSESKIQAFLTMLASGQLDEEVKNLVLIVDGFTRLSAEEELLVQVLHKKGAEVVIGTYASKKAYQAVFCEGNLYQAGVDFLRKMAQDFAVKPEYLDLDSPEDGFVKISRVLESRYDFSQVELDLSESEKSQLQLWSCGSQKEELEYVAKSIRQKVHDGARYKDIRLLLGDVEAYHLQLGTVFAAYDIPFYLGRRESMAYHPLVQFIESLLALKRYNFRSEDLLNLLKSGLYLDLSRRDLDHFEQYVRFADIKGWAGFSRDFTKNKRQKFDLDSLNETRKKIMGPLEKLLKSRSQTALGLLKKFQEFMEEARLSSALSRLLTGLSQEEQEGHEEVWKAFSHILEQFLLVFEGSRVGVEDFLTLLHSGMLLSSYRTTPATVDVVNVQAYDLIEPLVSDIVYAVGLTQDNFPQLSQNQSLLSDEERLLLNQETPETAELMVVSRENLKRHRFVALTLFNAAKKELILSLPQLINEVEGRLSPYLTELCQPPLSFELETKKREATSDDVGSYRGLLARLVELYQEEIRTEELSTEETSFWTVAIRVLRKKLAQEGIRLPQIMEEVKSQPLSRESLDLLYPKDQPFFLSTSALTEFYRHQYAYFLRYVLGLEEEWTLRPDARSHGNFLHRIFEKVMEEGSDQFDERLEQAIIETSQEKEFANLYENGAENRFIRDLLLDTARATSRVLAQNRAVQVLEEEAVFGSVEQAFLELPDGRQVFIRGKVDRIDSLEQDGSLGVVDYKSSDTNFHFAKFYNGLNSQLPTYISALLAERSLSDLSQIFGAMYLQMTSPSVALSSTKNEGEAIKESLKSLEYKGLLLEEKSAYLGEFYNKNKANLLSQADLELVLAYNRQLYQKAAQGILAGHFAINPYTENGRHIAPYVDQFKAITGFEADRHLTFARHLDQLDASLGKNLRGEKLKQAWLDKIKEDMDK